MKALHLFLAAIFILFAYFNLNDPDSTIWIVTYLLVAVLNGIVAFRPLPSMVLLVPAFAVMLWAATLAPSFWDYLTNHDGYDITQGMSFDKAYIEESREFFGLILAAVGLLFPYFRMRKLNTAKAV